MILPQEVYCNITHGFLVYKQISQQDKISCYIKLQYF